MTHAGTSLALKGYKSAIAGRLFKLYSGGNMIRLSPFLAVFTLPAFVLGAELPKYYAHPAVLDEHGVVAPWYHGINGPCDYRVRIAAETLKRYPWTTTSNAVAAYPHYVFSGTWNIDSNGVITPRDPGDWANGDLGQRATSIFNGMVDYYAYTGDPAAIAHLTYMADFILDHSLTPPDHSWPGLFISVPVKGKAYGDANPHGMIQLDICAWAGRGLLRAYQLTGNQRYFDAVKHWGDLLALHCNLSPTADPWPRYANPEDVKWGKQRNGNKQTGGVTMIMSFLDELIRLGHPGEADALVKAREAGRRYLSDKLLPAWSADPTWGYFYWDWMEPVENCITAPDAAAYLMEHPQDFPNWHNDARNILTLFFNRTSSGVSSGGDVYSGAWAYPESKQCCGRSLWYPPLCLAPTLAELAVHTGDSWVRELAYRQFVLQTYGVHENGVTEDSIDGGVIVNGDWFNIAHPIPLRFLLEAMGWLPEELGPSRENHIMRSTSVVNSVRYGAGQIQYSTFDAPPKTTEVLRLAFIPDSITADGVALPRQSNLSDNGYTVKELPNGDSIVAIRHDGLTNVTLLGKDPQQALDPASLSFEGDWEAPTSDAMSRVSPAKGAFMTARFSGNQVRVIGRADPSGGLADIYLDGKKQLVPIDFWNPSARSRQVLYYRNGLDEGPHVLRIVSRGEHNPYSFGDRMFISGVQFSTADARYNFPSGQGPIDTQRMIFGYTGREDYRDAHGHSWRPGTEFVTRGTGKDTVAAFWWTKGSTNTISGSEDPELYRYGVHCHDFWVNVTVGPGKYFARLKFAAARGGQTPTNSFAISVNGRSVEKNFDAAARGGGPNQAVDLVFNDITPLHGIIQVRLKAPEGSTNQEAFLQAIEVGPGDGGKGAASKSVSLLSP